MLYVKFKLLTNIRQYMNIRFFFHPPILILGLLSSLFLSSCVSSKKYKEAQSDISRLRTQQRDLQADLVAANSRIELMENANRAALNQLEEKDLEIYAQSSALEDQQSKLQQLQALIDRQRIQTEELRSKMAQALRSFSNEELSVFTKDGKVYVSLSEQLLFPSGSAEVNQEGKSALETLAFAIKEQPDIHLNIEGHTDTVPIRIKFQDNWALSVARSTAIVRILTEDFGIDPRRVVASGKSQYEPVADNTTPEGRAKNRRTEIILAPKLDQLMQLIDSYDD